jgi:hypothetical protein
MMMSVILCSRPWIPKLSTINHLNCRSELCCNMSLSDFLDAAPNLTTLDTSGCKDCDFQWMKRFANTEDFIRGGSGYRTKVMNVHTNLQFLQTGISMRNVESLTRTFKTFSNLEPLYTGGWSHSSVCSFT